MKANPLYLGQGPEFWAYVRLITRGLDASDRKTHAIKHYSMDDIFGVVLSGGYPSAALGTREWPSQLAVDLFNYFDYRSNILNGEVERSLMDVDEAAQSFSNLCNDLGVGSGEPVFSVRGRERIHSAQRFNVNGVEVIVAMNKQKGDKRNIQYFTGMIDLIVADSLKCEFDFDPRGLATFDNGNTMYGTFARRMDGAYPSIRNPRALWEIKEYYYTTTFGSKISDAVYITELDGYEREELQQVGASTKLYLMVDSHFTWWHSGKAYLCRLIDILNMGKVDGIFFGKEVLNELPAVASSWLL